MQQEDDKKELASLGWLFLVSMIIHVAGSVLQGIIYQRDPEFPVELALIISEMTILIPSVIYILIRNMSIKEDLGFRPIRAGSVLMCVLLSVLVSAIASFINVFSQLFVSNTMVGMSESLLGGYGLAVLFLAAIYGPFCEEFLFRAILFNRYDRYVGPLRAGLISAALFALAHMNINQAAYAFVLGVIFSIINKAAGSVYPSIIIHACINGANMLMLLAMGAAAEALGDKTDIVESAEAARQSDAIYVLLGVTFFAAVICTLIAIPCVVWLSKHEGKFDDLTDMFTVKHENAGWLRLPTVLGMAFLLFIMFGLEPVMKLLNG